jgi:hypothetical protein
MKKSVAVPASLVMTVAASLAVSACSGEQDCLDAGGRVVSSSYCRSGSAGYRYSGVARGGFGSGGGSSFGG